MRRRPPRFFSGWGGSVSHMRYMKLSKHPVRVTENDGDIARVVAEHEGQRLTIAFKREGATNPDGSLMTQEDFLRELAVGSSPKMDLEFMKPVCPT